MSTRRTVTGVAPSVVPIVILAFFSQTYISMTHNSPGIFAPVVSAALGVSPRALGVFFWIFGLAALVSTLLGPSIIRRVGGARLLQMVGVGTTLGLLLAATGSLWIVTLCAIVMGASVGPHVAAIMHLLARAAPVHRLGFLVSLGQAGGAIGVGLGGVIIPRMILGWGWEATLAVLAIGGVVLAAAIQPMRAALDNDRNRHYPISAHPVALIKPLLGAMRERVLREIMIAGLLLSMLFQSLVGFVVSYLNLELGYSLVVAGLALTASQIAALFARLTFGWLADRIRDPFIVLAGIGTGAFVSGLAMATIGPDWPVWLIYLLSAAYGVAASGWVGTCFGAMALHTRKEEVASATSSLQFIMILGGMLGPLFFAGIASLTGKYWIAYTVFTLFGAIVGWRMMRLRRRLPAPARAR